MPLKLPLFSLLGAFRSPELGSLSNQPRLSSQMRMTRAPSKAPPVCHRTWLKAPTLHVRRRRHHGWGLRGQGGSFDVSFRLSWRRHFDCLGANAQSGLRLSFAETIGRPSVSPVLFAPVERTTPSLSRLSHWMRRSPLVIAWGSIRWPSRTPRALEES